MEVSSGSINHLVEFGSEEGQWWMKGGRARSEAGLRTKCPHLTLNNYKTRLHDKGPAPGVLAVFVLVSLIPVFAFWLQICFAGSVWSLLSFKHFMVSRSLNMPRSGFTLPVDDISPWHWSVRAAHAEDTHIHRLAVRIPLLRNQCCL